MTDITVPDLSAVTPEFLDRLLAEAVARQEDAWRRIAEDPAAPTFATTVDPLEDAWRDYADAMGLWFVFTGSMGTAEVLALQDDWAPRLAEHETAAARNGALVARVRAVPRYGLTAEQERVLDEWLRSFERAGAFVAEQDRAELAAIDDELARLSARFGAGLLEGASAAALLVEDPEELEGLSPARISAAARAAEEAGHPGGFLLGHDLFAAPAVLSSLRNPRTRARLYANSVNRGRGPVRDAGTAETPEILSVAARMAALRARRAGLFGARTHAELALRDTVAGSLDRALGMLEDLVPRALENFRKELETMAEVAGTEAEEISAADVPYWLERVARERYAVDAEALRPYFELHRVVEDGVFYAARRLYGLEFRPLEDVALHVPEARAWQVLDGDGAVLGVFVADWFARPTKQGGAWMHDLVSGDARIGRGPVVMNTLNLPEPPEGEPALLSVDNVRTLFHEFGHALHSLLSRAGHPSVAGTNVPRDFVEYPSQVNEMWMLDPEVLAHYAIHHETGEPLPQETVDALRASEQWGQGFGTAEYLGAALLDLAWHTRSTEDGFPETPREVRDFEESVLARYGFDRLPVAPRYLTGLFKHVFDGGYAAGYYSYIFSEAMDAETVDWFRENGGLDRAAGDRFRAAVLSRANAQDPAQSFRDLRGRDPEAGPLLRRRGLDEPAAGTAGQA